MLPKLLKIATLLLEIVAAYLKKKPSTPKKTKEPEPIKKDDWAAATKLAEELHVKPKEDPKSSVIVDPSAFDDKSRRT